MSAYLGINDISPILLLHQGSYVQPILELNSVFRVIVVYLNSMGGSEITSGNWRIA